VVAMKLNGKFYVKKSDIVPIMQYYLDLLDSCAYSTIFSSPSEIGEDNLKLVNEQLIELNKTLCELFEEDFYVKHQDIMSVVDETKYDATRYEVGLHKTGAYGVQTRASNDSVMRYAYNYLIDEINVKLDNIRR
jgi:hypothetical protein